jgi:hypothetical protein
VKTIKRKAEFLYDENGNEKAVLLDINVYRLLLEKAEMLDTEMQEDIEDYHRGKAASKADIDSGNTIRVDDYIAQRFGKSKKKRE